MGFRFQKRIKLMLGITLNLSRKGISTSIGTTGARVTLGHGQTRVTGGIPSSGISHTTITKHKQSQQQQFTAPIEQLQNTSYPKTKLSRAAAIFWFLVVLFSIFGVISALVTLSLR